MIRSLQYPPWGWTGLTTGCNWFKDETEPSVDVADEDEDVEDDVDVKTASLDTEASATGDKDVDLFTTATVLLPRAWTRKSKSSPSSSSTT